jgi:hypothetical protein
MQRVIGLTVLALGIAGIVSNLGASEGSRTRTPEEVVRAYTQAANEGDLEAFLAQYAPGIRKYRFPGELASEGIEHNRKVYTKAFASYPDLKVEIRQLIVQDEIVVAHDRVTGRPDGKTSDEITVYEVKDGLITNIVYVKQSVR